ncbi:hypothetical protein [Cellulomonas fimi]|uniref:Uncharacterized protein n=1 Tax=Cellulomonas fimi (strain ATCC 484 / DSM 20113 / JCM 1341 / CCUG 24087 / LMG 16345 / NBRC 15513 / NCIMB 8980 / NCTC 7547 / NRS-133) TaxID=590998 RepID=F4H7L8_CELFA|nr:hypothetical protein [Cellulomonas fimi]AEE44575.1 hypothetical protein Celf_0432 [Cellulomonas fimi ATCC 484]NNH06449.1 hypothetical protein [Cellulomonas fimi]VEH26668.1 Uncharacterised protein [Cellulomonas fimi]
MTGAGALDVTGVAVEQVVTDPAVPAVTHARFTARSSGTAARRLAVSGVRVRFPERTVTVGDVFVYRLPAYDEVPAGAIEVPAGREDEFEVSFAGVPLESGLAVDVAVEVEIATDAGVLVAVSPWTGTVRTPRR